MLKLIVLAFFSFQFLTCFGAHPWEPEARDLPLHQQYVNETKTHGKDIQIVFYGDSITHGWAGNGKTVWDKHYAPLHAVNYGIGGDRTQHIIWRIENGEVEGLHPKLVVLKIGTNNLGSIGHGVTEEDIAKGIKTIIDLIHTKLPQSKVLLLGILPRGTANGTYIPHIKNINTIISKYANGNTIEFLNMEKQYEDAEGHVKPDLFVSDLLHLSPKGYEIWAETMDPLLKKMIGGNVSHVTPNPWEPENRDVPLHKHILETTKKEGSNIKIVFFGDSLTEGWSGNGKEIFAEHYGHLHAVNYGIGGDRTQHLIWRIENGEFDGLSPKLLVLLIGGNNLRIKSVTEEDIAKGVKTILELLHTKLPHTNILLLGKLPAIVPGFTAEQFRLRIRHYNSLISKFANGQTIQFLDMGSHFEDADGHLIDNLYSSDHVHPSKEGYKVWAQVMDPLFQKMLNQN